MITPQIDLQRQAAQDDVPEDLSELLVELSRLLTREEFQCEIDRRLGALLRVSGIDFEILPRYLFSGNALVPSRNLVRIPLDFAESDADLVLQFSFRTLSRSSREVLYQTAIAILNDWMKLLSASEASGQDWLDNTAGRLLPKRCTVECPQLETLYRDRPAVAEGQGGFFLNQQGAANVPQDMPSRFAHRLRNLLTSITSASSQLLESNLSSLHPDDQTLVRTIEKAAEAQRCLIDRYLLLYGPGSLHLRTVDLDETLRRIVADYDSRLTRETNIASTANRLAVTADVALLAQILTELLDNGYEAGGEVSIAVRRNGTSDRVMILVKNRGLPENAEFSEKFFEPFFTTKPGHSGLGLPIARRNAGVMGGNVTGSCLKGFTLVAVSLPLTANSNAEIHLERNS